MRHIDTKNLVGIFAVIALVSLGTMTTQIVYAQNSTTASEDLTELITTITGLITTIAALAGGIVASYAKMSQKLGLNTDKEIEKMLLIAQELQNTDQWSRQLEERLVAIGEVIASTQDGQKLLEDKRIDLKQWKDEASKLDQEISDIYKKLLIPLLEKK